MKFLHQINLPIMIASLFLLSMGILVIYSSSPQLAIQQLIFAILSFSLFIFVSNFDYRVIKNFTSTLYLCILLLLVGVLVLGVETRGAIRWIPLGLFNIQPSELAKPVLILTLADFWSRNSATFKNILKSLMITLPLLFLVFQQPDLGSTLTILAIWLGMLFAAGVQLRKISVLIIVSLLLVPLIWFSLQEYQKERIFGFIAPQTDPLGKGYNLIQSTIAVGSGEFFGRGLGRGTQSRLQFLPEFRTDFIFASIAEEMGFIGSMIIIILYLFLIIVITAVSTNVIDYFGHLLVFGVCAMLLFQTFVNIGMNVGLLPITGITLPLISYGGSSLLSTFICLGLVSSVSRYRKKVDTE